MADNKTRPSTASVQAYIGALSDLQRTDAGTLTKLMRTATGEAPKMWGPSIIGFGSYHYVYESGREGDMPLVGFSARKAAIVLYVHLGLWDAAALLSKLGKHATGKGCLYIKRLANVDLKTLELIITKSVAAMRAKNPAG